MIQMTDRVLPIVLLLLVGSLTPLDSNSAFGQAEIDRSTRPNLIILFADDLGYGELGSQGNPQIPTPHIDRIAAEGVRFTNGYVTASYCSASRAGLMTGRYQTRFGYEFNPIGADNEDPGAGLPVGQRTLANHLHDLGYATALVGKWHLGGTARYHPQRRGFDEFFGFTHEGHYYLPPPYRGSWTMLRRRTLPVANVERFQVGQTIYTNHMGHDEPAYDANNPIVRGSQPVEESEYLTDAFTREAVDFIQRHRDQPFFLFLSYSAVHSPLQATDELVDRFEDIDDIHRRIFAGMVASLDDGVGEVLDTLDELELDQHTIVIFLSDNGGPTRELTSSNAPLREGKGSLYEGGVRVPYMIRWPDRIDPHVSDRVVSSLDIFATMVDVTGSEPPREGLDGVSLASLVEGRRITEVEDNRVLFWRMNQKVALRYAQWKLVGRLSQGGKDRWELFDLSEDVGETTDVSGQHSQIQSELIEEWHSINQGMIDPVWSRPRR